MKKVKDDICVMAVPSGKTATSGRIVAKYKSFTQEIPAVVFTEDEIKKLFEGLILMPSKRSKYFLTRVLGKRK